ncbi:MAG: peptidase M20 [SAR202 cluster bacterium Io17-Chloro-G9]|nr:MAG: peptidase M20 [SAR202 cluster bacterium Io17-Chloro-G9]
MSLRPVELAQSLIRFDTSNPPGNETQCVGYIDGLLRNAGFLTTLVARSPGRPNLITRLAGQGNAPPLLLYGHLDVVPADPEEWRVPPFEGRIEGGFLWGRGALDMKGGIAMMLVALLRAKAEGLPLPGDVILALVSDEEAGGDDGAGYLVQHHSNLFEGVRFALGEFGGFSFALAGKRFYPIMVAEKQVCHLRMTVKGVEAHGSLGTKGGAMSSLARLLVKLERDRLPVHITPVARAMFQAVASRSPLPTKFALSRLLNPRLTRLVLKLMGANGQTFDPLLRNTVNATVVRGGQGVNMAPGRIELQLDGRLLPGFTPQDLINEVRHLVDDPALNDLVEMEVIRHDPGPTEPDMGLFETLAGVLRRLDPVGVPVPMLLPASTDSRFFSRLGIQTYGFLPMPLPEDLGFLRTVHGPDERIPLEALTFGADAIYQMLQEFHG